ncbi:MAG: hypothetical protein CSA09_00410 [Candidatus Contendobacter odensis]|uniref:CdiI immunity protein domain-containing protein n=1 Tax=Candidatus Contendibacter odensensis TaxID=1400860 RepID=A0A2G6PFQ4_9GAMM|nr:MAG: hypothetical protein CSA09_00410 [Candidatus Contendobacter odensis]
MTENQYPRLADFMGGWFHQDFDIEGETVAEVVAVFLNVTPLVEQEALRADIERFLAEHMHQLDDDFEAIFQPDVLPYALSGSTRAFLEEIRALLAPD